MKFALIGGGVVGRCYAQAFVQSGATLCGVLDTKPTPQLKELTDSNAVEIHAVPGAWLNNADYVLSAVYGKTSLVVAEQALQFMKSGTLYIDMTTAPPEMMAEASAVADQCGVGFVDVAITGAVNMRGAKTPLLCAGERAGVVAELFGSIGAPIRVVGERPGDAGRLKLLRSVFSKGLEALTIECLTTAEIAGLREQLHEVLLDLDQTPLKALMETLVTTHIEHAARRRDEVLEAQQLMRANGIEPIVLTAVQTLFERSMEALKHVELPGSGPDAAIEWLVHSATGSRQHSGA